MVKLKRKRMKSTFKKTARVTVNNKVRKCEKNLKKMYVISNHLPI